MITINEAIRHAQSENRMAFIGYLPAGYPDPDAFIRAVEVCSKAGMDILEIGLPSNNPRFDGVVIRRAQEMLVERGIDTDRALELGALSICQAGCAGLAMLYSETIDSYGVEKLLKRCTLLGVAAVLSVGMNASDWKDLAISAREYGIDLIAFVEPDASNEKIKDLVINGSGYLYVQSRRGLTGGQVELDEQVEAHIRSVNTLAKAHELPVAVGFGIREPADVASLAKMGVDAFIVGTALVEAVNEGKETAARFVQGLVNEAKLG